MRILVLAALFCARLASATEPLSLPPELSLPCGLPEQQLLDDLADGRLDDFSVLRAALLASGTSDTQSAACIILVAEKVAAWQKAGLEGTPRQRAQALFDHMHREFLTGGYQHDASDLAEAILHGRFNCVSATLLWQHLAVEFKLPAVARQLPGHVQSLLKTGDRWLVIETTCPEWFLLIDEDGRPRTAGIAREGVPTASETAGEARELNDAELIASVYYNRGLTLLARRDFPASLAATHAAHRLDPESSAARSNVLATLNNWALHLAEHGQSSRAIGLLEAGQSMDATHESFRVNLDVLRGRADGLETPR